LYIRDGEPGEMKVEKDLDIPNGDRAERWMKWGAFEYKTSRRPPLSNATKIRVVAQIKKVTCIYLTASNFGADRISREKEPNGTG
jgi:hypothetical protein